MNETPQENNELVTIERRDDGVTIATLNRADHLNALSVAMTSAITDAFRMLHRDRSTKAVVLAGAGRAFCAGADLSGDSEPAPDSEDRGPVGSIYRMQQHLADMIVTVHECDKPVIAAISGAAVGGGLALALAADWRSRAWVAASAGRGADARGGTHAQRSYLPRRGSGSFRHAEPLRNRWRSSRPGHRAGAIDRT